MLELIKTRKTSEAVLNFPEEVHCVDREGNHHRLSEENGMFFYEGKINRVRQYRFAACLQDVGPELVPA